MYARGAWGWVGWVATTCVIATAIVHGIPAAQAHPIGSTDRQAYTLATGDLFPELPVQRVEYVDKIAGYPNADGLYEPQKATILVRVPDDDLPKTEYVQIIRHEYGHVLLYTWCEKDSYGDPAFEGVIHYTVHNTDALPDELAGVAREYRDDPDAFGAYGGTDLAEWLGEAFVAYMAHGDVPPRTVAFFDSMKKQAVAAK